MPMLENEFCDSTIHQKEKKINWLLNKYFTVLKIVADKRVEKTESVVFLKNILN